MVRTRTIHVQPDARTMHSASYICNHYSIEMTYTVVHKKTGFAQLFGFGISLHQAPSLFQIFSCQPCCLKECIIWKMEDNTVFIYSNISISCANYNSSSVFKKYFRSLLNETLCLIWAHTGVPLCSISDDIQFVKYFRYADWISPITQLAEQNWGQIQH